MSYIGKLLSILLFCSICRWTNGLVAEGSDTEVSPASLCNPSDEECGRRMLEKVKPEHFADAVSSAISRGWWDLAGDIVKASHAAGIDISGAVRAAALNMKKKVDEIVRQLDKKADTLQKVSPSFQWAQSLEAVYLLIKFAFRWSSPGALEVVNETIKATNSTFYFSGYGTNSHVGKVYELNLGLYNEIIPETMEWSFSSVGRLSVTLKKKVPANWQRLTNSTEKIPNMHSWFEMQERLQSLDENAKRAEENEERQRIKREDKDDAKAKETDNDTAADKHDTEAKLDPEGDSKATAEGTSDNLGQQVATEGNGTAIAAAAGSDEL